MQYRYMFNLVMPLVVSKDWVGSREHRGPLTCCYVLTHTSEDTNKKAAYDYSTVCSK